MPNRPSLPPSTRWVAPALAVLLTLSACQRNDEPTPGVAGGSADAPAAAGSQESTAPQAPDAQVGAGKSPGGPTSADRIPPDGTTGAPGTPGATGAASAASAAMPPAHAASVAAEAAASAAASAAATAASSVPRP